MPGAGKIRPRRGSIYVLIIGVTMLAAAITIAASLAGRAQSRALDSSNNASEARSYAQAAIDLGRLYIAQDSNWRTTHSNGTWFSGMSIGSGSMSLDVTNPAGALNRFNADPVVMTGTGTCGSSVQKLQVSVTPTIKPYTCLQTAMLTGASIQFGSSQVSPSGVLISSNGSMTLNSASIAPNLEAVGTISVMSGHYSGTAATGVPARTMPGSNVFDYYTANGTTISFSSLPFWSNTQSLSFGVLTPTVNTFRSGTNPNGIYVIDCQGQQFTIGNAHICATVVLLNCGGLYIKAVNWVPAVSTLPCLLVQGNIVSIKLSASAVSETTLLVNLNPSGAPYPWPTGLSNSLLTDTYANSIRGLIYATGSVTFGDDASIGMLICGGSITCGSKSITLTYNPDYYTNPPPGFYDVDMTAAPATWTQITN